MLNIHTYLISISFFNFFKDMTALVTFIIKHFFPIKFKCTFFVDYSLMEHCRSASTFWAFNHNNTMKPLRRSVIFILGGSYDRQAPGDYPGSILQGSPRKDPEMDPETPGSKREDLQQTPGLCRTIPDTSKRYREPSEALGPYIHVLEIMVPSKTAGSTKQPRKDPLRIIGSGPRRSSGS